MLIPTRQNTSSGRLAPSPFELGSASASVDGAVVRGVAVAPKMPPDPLGDAPGVPFEDGAALGEGGSSPAQGGAQADRAAARSGPSKRRKRSRPGIDGLGQAVCGVRGRC